MQTKKAIQYAPEVLALTDTNEVGVPSPRPRLLAAHEEPRLGTATRIDTRSARIRPKRCVPGTLFGQVVVPSGSDEILVTVAKLPSPVRTTRTAAFGFGCFAAYHDARSTTFLMPRPRWS